MSTLTVSAYTTKVYTLREGDRITSNSAYCGKCKDTLVSKAVSDIFLCKCKNVGVAGGRDLINHKWIDKDFYHNRSIVLIRGD